MVDAQAVQTGELSDAYEVNTEGWDIDQQRKDGRGSKYKSDESADSPFQVYQTDTQDPEQLLTKDEIA